MGEWKKSQIDLEELKGVLEGVLVCISLLLVCWFVWQKAWARSYEETYDIGSSYCITESRSPIGSWFKPDSLIIEETGLRFFSNSILKQESFFVSYESIDNITMKTGAYYCSLSFKEKGFLGSKHCVLWRRSATSEKIEQILQWMENKTKVVRATSVFRTILLTRVSNNRGSTPSPKAASKPAVLPEVGDIQQGYRFKGGDPADPKNWGKVMAGPPIGKPQKSGGSLVWDGQKWMSE